MTTAHGRSSQSVRATFGVMRDVRQGALFALVTLGLGIAAWFLAPLLLQGGRWEPFEVRADVSIASLLIAFSFLCDGFRAEKRVQRGGLS